MLSTLKTYIAFEGAGRMWGLLGLASLSLLGALMEVAGLGLILPLVEIIGSPETVRERSWFAPLTYVAGDSVQAQVVVLAGILCGIFVLKNVFMAFMVRLQSRVITGWRSELAQRLVSHYLCAPYTFHLKHNSAELLRNIVFVTETFFLNFLLGLIQSFAYALITLAIVLFLVAQDPLVIGLSFLFVGALFGAQRLYFRRRQRLLGEEYTEVVRQRQQFLQQLFGVVKEVKVLRREEGFIRESRRIQDDYGRNSADFMFMSQLPAFIQEALVMVSFLLVIMALVGTQTNTQAYLPTLALLAGGAFRLLPALNKLMGGLNLVSRGEHAAPILFDALKVLRDDPDVQHVLAEGLGDQGVPALPTETAPPRPVVERDLVLHDVCYTYEGASHPALRNVTLTIGRGAMIGLAGPSGAGKSTLADLLLGLYQPDSGAVLIDGKPASLRRTLAGRVSYVPQSIYILDDTLRRNVALGIQDQDIDEARVRRALGMAQLDALLADLPDGLETMLGEHGARLSGGQRQRIGIARALYSDPEILILDEATSALDVHTEAEVAAAVESLRGVKTVLVIAHRLSTLRSCDRVVLMRDGAIANEGSFAELCDKDHHFQEMMALSRMS